MNKKRKRTQNKSAALVAGLTAIVIIVAVMCSSYVGYLHEMMRGETNRYLTEVSRHVSSLIQTHIEMEFQTLSSIAETYVQLEDRSLAEEYLREKVEQLGYLRIGIVGRDGISHTTDGYTVDMTDQACIRRALSGENTVSNLTRSRVNGEDSIYFAVPLRSGGEVSGVLVSVNSKDKISNALNVESFDGEGYSHVIDTSGGFVLRSENKNSAKGSDNFVTMLESRATFPRGYDVENFKRDLAARQAGVLYFTLADGIERATNYIPIPSTDWVLISSVPTLISEKNPNMFVRMSIVMMAIIVTLFLMLNVLIIMLQRKSRKRLEHLAYVDDVTGGYSPARFKQEAEELIYHSPKNTFAMVSLDMQKFKVINDTFGSTIGDKILWHVHNVISSNLTKDELVCRTMADHFYLLLKYTNHEQVKKRLDRMAERINAFNEALLQKYYITMIEGVYVISDLSQNLITIQDRAVVARKSIKTDQSAQLSNCAFYSELERIRLVREKEIENRMDVALANGEFIVYLQPKVELAGNRVAGAEALVRWQDPKKGLIMPGEFIGLFEKNGFIAKLDLYVFEQVCRMIHRWIATGIQPVSVSVNLSYAHLMQPDFLELMRQTYTKYSIPPELIEIELTETLVFENLNRLVALIDKIHALGFKFSLDDFGSGYSSLNILKDVPADIIKLDRAFFIGEDDTRGRYVVESVIGLAKKLDMQTVAEGVESIDQVEFLRRARCDLVQGFVFSRPVPIPEFEALAFGREEPVSE